MKSESKLHGILAFPELGKSVAAHLSIAKAPLCLLVALSAYFGAVLAPASNQFTSIFVLTGVFLISCGAATLNSVQERYVDRQLQRTRLRPLVTGTITPRLGIVQAQLLFAAGFAILLVLSSVRTAVVAACAVVLYNFIYTPLKHKTTWALVPGALCGALPPYIGWVAGHGYWFEPLIFSVLCLFLVWQVPHFWLVILSNKADYRKSSIPCLIDQISERSLRLISIVWVSALTTILQVVLLLTVGLDPVLRVLISAGSLVLFVVYGCMILISRNPSFRSLFIGLNFSMLLFIMTVSFGLIM